jgi:hypothetical protein
MALRRSNDNYGPLSRMSNGVSSLIGLATEFHAQRQTKKAVLHNDPEEIDTEMLENQDCPLPTTPRPTERDLTTAYVDRPSTIEPLPLPVILPQRRPNSKSRGFVRAYAPDLWHCKGIDQQTFLAFLGDFHKSSQASPVFRVINVAAMGAGFAPSAIAMAVSAAVSAASRAAIEVQSRIRTNNYLDKANEELFHPKSLHCMIMTFKPEAQDNVLLDFNLKNGAFSGVPTASEIWPSISNLSENRLGRKLRQSDGMSEGQLAIPQAAHLIFPTPTAPDGSPIPGDAGEHIDGLPSPHKHNPSSWKNTRKFVSEYKDRRAQADFAGKYGQDSTLAVPGATDPGKFASRFSDPNHPVNSGHPLALLTGGKIRNPDDVKAKLVRLTGREPTVSSKDRVITEVKNMSKNRIGSSPGLLGGVTGMMKSDVLYLLIAEMPTDEEMAQLTREI